MNIQNTFKPELGVQNGKLSSLSRKPNCVSTQTEAKAKSVPVIGYSKNLSDQMQQVIRVIEAMPGAKIKQCTGNYVYAVFTTRLMRFKDDVEIYLDDAAKTMHFRSASRLGYSDLGVNRKRYERFARQLRA
jgi:uncharacterized protein (DUF1499 family)